MNEQKHIINRQVLELTVPERDRVQFIQNKTSEIVKQKLLPKLDELFSKLVSADEIIRIDKMVIDLGIISENEMEIVFVESAVKEIGDKISKIKNSGSNYSGKTPVNDHLLATNKNVVITPKSNDWLEQFIYFLKKGHFPWWHKLSAKNKLDEIFAESLKIETALFRSAIIPLLGNPLVRQRLVFQFNHSQLNSLLEKINYQLIKSYFASFLVLLSIIKTAKKRKEITGQFYEIALQYFSVEQELATENIKIGFVKDIIDLHLTKCSVADKEIILTEIIRSLQLREIIETPNDANLTLVASILAALELPSRNQHLQIIIQDIITDNGDVINKHIKKFNKKAVRKRTVKKAGSENELENGREMIFADNITGINRKKSDKSVSHFSPKISDDSEEISVSNAGLVLIHPFLRYFFEGLNLLDNDLKFKSKTETFKAIHLLQYIVTGEETTMETELPLNKILCGLELTEPVPKSVMLLKEEKEECAFLIKTVLERWEALKTSNHEALRETYLQRDGILKKSGMSWSLTVERNTFDIMLEKLPWSINLIKLPWLTQIIYVEW